MTNICALTRLTCATCRTDTLHANHRCVHCGSQPGVEHAKEFDVHRVWREPAKKKNKNGMRA